MNTFNQKAKTIEILFKALPNPERIENIEIDTHPYIVRFNWNSKPFKVHINDLSVEEIDGAVCVTNNMTLLMETILRNYMLCR